MLTTSKESITYIHVVKQTFLKGMNMTFSKWIETFVNEKNLMNETIQVEGNSGTNHIPVEILLEYMNNTSKEEQKQIKNILVQIDFKNGDVMHFFNHLAKAIAI